MELWNLRMQKLPMEFDGLKKRFGESLARVFKCLRLKHEKKAFERMLKARVIRKLLFQKLWRRIFILIQVNWSDFKIVFISESARNVGHAILCPYNSFSNNHHKPTCSSCKSCFVSPLIRALKWIPLCRSTKAEAEGAKETGWTPWASQSKKISRACIDFIELCLTQQ